MKIVYMGTPEFAVPSLEALYKAGHEICYFVTQPDAVTDRGRKVMFAPVKEKALELGIEVLQPKRIREDVGFIEKIRMAAPDIIAVAAYGQILPKEILDIPSLGCINVHGSLLPRFRGAAPVQRAIMAGDEETGITIMYMEEGLDTGDMLSKKSTKIGSKNGQQLHDELAEMGAELLVKTLSDINNIKGEKQDDEKATYAPMISKQDGHIDFSKSPEEIERMIRAFDPWPGSYSYLNDKPMKFWKAEALNDCTESENGTVIAAGKQGIDVAASGRVLRIKEIQMPGKKRVMAEEYLKGNLIEIGTVLR